MGNASPDAPLPHDSLRRAVHEAARLLRADGAILYLDGAMLVDNDGTHYTASKTGSKALKKGHHDFKLDYFQGPRYHITMQLSWKCGAAKDYTIIPASAFTRPLK